MCASMWMCSSAWLCNSNIVPEPEAPKFKRGDEVTVVRKMSWNIPLRKKPKFRKDLAAGTEGVIEKLGKS